MYSARDLLTSRGDDGFLGRGSFGCVRLAFHKHLGWVALKCSSYSEKRDLAKFVPIFVAGPLAEVYSIKFCGLLILCGKRWTLTLYFS